MKKNRDQFGFRETRAASVRQKENVLYNRTRGTQEYKKFATANVRNTLVIPPCTCF